MNEFTTDDLQWLNDRLDGVQTRVVGIPSVRQGELFLWELVEEEVRFYNLIRVLHLELQCLLNDPIAAQLSFCRPVTSAEFDELYRRTELVERRFWERFEIFKEYNYQIFSVRRQKDKVVIVAS